MPAATLAVATPLASVAAANAVQPVDAGSAAFAASVVYSNTAPDRSAAYSRLSVFAATRSPPFRTRIVPFAAQAGALVMSTAASAIAVGSATRRPRLILPAIKFSLPWPSRR